jgi:hypothetical protein
MTKLSALRTGRLYSTGKIPDSHFCCRTSRPRGHTRVGMIKSTKNLKDPTANSTRDILAVEQCLNQPRYHVPCNGSADMITSSHKQKQTICNSTKWPVGSGPLSWQTTLCNSPCKMSILSLWVSHPAVWHRQASFKPKYLYVPLTLSNGPSFSQGPHWMQRNPWHRPRS